ncbi:MAG: hypothetical protein EXQ59_05765, partial [Acidobacteria bacterium]|nr:hypothetical protein [Acidobacteriota bacterium]
MNSIVSTVAMSVGLAVALLFAGLYLSKDNHQAAVWAFLAAYIFAGMGIAFEVRKWLGNRSQQAEARTALSRDVDLRAAEIRPYIDVFNPVVVAPLALGQTPVVRVSLKNTGRTPAVDVTVGSRVQVGDFPLFT